MHLCGHGSCQFGGSWTPCEEVSEESVSLGTRHHQQSPLDHCRVSWPQLDKAWRRFKGLITYTSLHPCDDSAWLCLWPTSTLLCWLELNCLSPPPVVAFPGSPVKHTDSWVWVCPHPAFCRGYKLVSAHNCWPFQLVKFRDWSLGAPQWFCLEQLCGLQDSMWIV